MRAVLVKWDMGKWLLNDRYLSDLMRQIAKTGSAMVELDVQIHHQVCLTAACGLHAAQDGCECGPTQNCKCISNIMRFFCV